MGNKTSFGYHFAPSATVTAGNMICELCNNKIDSKTQDWASYQQHTKYDWGYKSFHRKCAKSDDAWNSITQKTASEKQAAKECLANIRELLVKVSSPKYYQCSVISEIKELLDVNANKEGEP